MKTLYFLISIIFFYSLIAFTPSNAVKSQIGFNEITTHDELDQQDIFSFSVLGDNHGTHPFESIELAKMTKWVSTGNDEFVLGVGDHLQKNKENDFLSFLVRNEWWKNNFYPAIGDADNDYFGTGQDDWGAGGALLKILGFNKRKNIELRENGAEYYAQIKVDDITVHYIVLHYPDRPDNIEDAFPETSRQYLINTLNKINKGPKDIIIASAHSRYGTWIDDLSKEQQKVVIGKCDLLLAGTTHYFERRVPKGLENSGPLMVSAGSINKARWGSKNGFLRVHVMKHPLSLVVQYVNIENENMQLESAPNSYVKYVNGGVYPLDFSKINQSQLISKAH